MTRPDIGKNTIGRLTVTRNTLQVGIALAVALATAALAAGVLLAQPPGEPEVGIDYDKLRAAVAEGVAAGIRFAEAESPKSFACAAEVAYAADMWVVAGMTGTGKLSRPFQGFEKERERAQRLLRECIRRQGP